VNRKLWRRFPIARMAGFTLVTCGLVTGSLLGCALAIQQASNWLDKYLRLTAAQDDAAFTEAQSVLKILKGSPYPACSDAEIAYFRGLVFRSEYLKDAGRIHGGRIDCSTTAGHQSRSSWPFKPETRREDGIIAYSNLVPIRDLSLNRAALQLGTAYVVLGANPPPIRGPVVPHITITPQDAAHRPALTLPASGVIHGNELNLTTLASARLGAAFSATRCSSLHFNCVTDATTVGEALRGGIITVAAGTVAGILFGILLATIFSFVDSRNRELRQQLQRAVNRGELQVVYQPIVDLATRRLVGAEALARWTDEEGNAVSPDVFVSTAEELGFVGGITRVVLHRALRDFARTFHRWPAFHLSVNVAGADLVDPTFLPMLVESLQRAKAKPKNLIIEITERSAANGEVAMETIRVLRRLGHRIHIDDFGTGHSNLDKLLYLYADTIKIDKAFTRVIGTESVAAAILPQILAMAKSLNLEVVVEGIETDQQADYFSLVQQKLYGQGWLYGRPVSAQEFHALLRHGLPVMPVTESVAILEPAGVPEPVGAIDGNSGEIFLVDSRAPRPLRNVS
jgi:sensor c-di-GMP phosphodiesterase-like protein